MQNADTCYYSNNNHSFHIYYNNQHLSHQMLRSLLNLYQQLNDLIELYSPNQSDDDDNIEQKKKINNKMWNENKILRKCSRPKSQLSW